MQLKTKTIKLNLLVILTIVCIVGTFLFPPIKQNLAYHAFADQRTVAGIPNFWNVITNLPFVFVGFYGLMLLRRANQFQLIYAMMFTGIILTGFGSAYYHLNPNNHSLVYDRIPMTIVFISFLSLTITECIDEKIGSVLLIPLVLIGIGSVLLWQYSDDLRLYGLVQFYPVLFVPLIYMLFPSNNSKQSWRIIRWVITWYVAAKLCEHFDKDVFQFTHFISGHSLKHLFAAVATYYLVLMIKRTGHNER
jgi:hypothetical protein